MAAGAALLLAAGCGSGGTGGDGTAPSNAPAAEAATIALFLPESKTTRYEQFDKPVFEAKLTQLCAACSFLYFNADQDAAKQQSQVESALTQGADVLVLDAVDADAVAPLVNQAKQKKIPVIAYDRRISGIGYDYFVSFDNVKVGEVQGQALLDELNKRGTATTGQIVMINGSPTDPSSADYKKGAHNALDGKVTIGREFDTPDWSPDKAQEQMEQAITSLGRDSIVGVYSANDGMASGAIAALKRAGYSDLPAADRPGRRARRRAADRHRRADHDDLPEHQGAGRERRRGSPSRWPRASSRRRPRPSTTARQTSRPRSSTRSPSPRTRSRTRSSQDGFYTVSDICTPDIATACTEAGLS